MVSITSGTWPLNNVGSVEEPGYLQTVYNLSGNCFKTIKNKINILFLLVKFYNLLMSIIFFCYWAICALIFGLASFVSWKIFWYLFNLIKNFLKKKPPDHQTIVIEEESISPQFTESNFLISEPGNKLFFIYIIHLF